MEHALIKTYWVIYYTAREKLSSRLAVGRKSREKKEDLEETFKTTFKQRVNLVISTNAPVFWDCLLPTSPSPNPKQETKMEEKPIKIFTQIE